MKVLTRILTFLSLLLLLSACGTLTEIQTPAVDHETGFVFQIDPERESVTLLEMPTLGRSLAPNSLPSDTHILVPNEDIALRNLSYRFRPGNRLVMRLKVKNTTPDLAFAQPFFFTLNEDTSQIKSATAPLVTDRDLGGDGVLNPGERTRRLTFEVKHKGRPFTFLIDTSAVVTSEAMGKIAFVSYRDGNAEIYVMNADGSEQTNLTQDPEDDRGPAWSPGGTHIAFEAEDRDEVTSGIYVMDADGSNPTRLTNPGEYTLDSRPAWSPDGTQIVCERYWHETDTASLFTMNADGSNLNILNSLTVAYDGNATWSPDGTKIAFDSTRDWAWSQRPYDVYVMNADGSDLTNLTNADEDGRGDRYPAWSPDGAKIAFRSDRDGNPEIYVMNADGSNPARLTDTPEDDSTPVWSPDGTQIAFERNHGGSAHWWEVEYEIYVMNADGSNPTRLTNSPGNDDSPVWSPDGTQIAFTSRRDGNAEIYVMDADGSNQTNLTNNPAADGAPAWQPAPR